MREFDPNDPMTRRELREVENEGAARFGMIGLFAALAIAVMVGVFFWTASDRGPSTAMNTAPGTTTGSSTTSPAAPTIIAPTAPSTAPQKNDANTR